MLKARLKATLLSLASRKLPYSPRISYSQFGEDIALHTLLRYYGIHRGSYLDVGAFHPVHLSNTYLLYQNGWSGVTVEPTPGVAAEFRAVRPRDVHLSCAASSHANGEPETFYSFGHGSPYNTMCLESAQAVSERLGQPYEATTVVVKTLNEILDEHFSAGRKLDLLCVDCEGADESLLQSLDWSRYKPMVIVFEEDAIGFDQIPARPIMQFLAVHGYSLFAKIGPSFVARQPRPGAA